MALTRLQQGQVSGTLGDNVNDSVSNADLLKANRTLEDDLNSLRSQIKRIQGTAEWTAELSGSQDLADIYAAMQVSGADASFQGDVNVAADLFVSGAAEVSGTLRVISNAISGAAGLNLMLGADGHVEVEGKLQVSGDEVEAASGNTVLRFADDNVYVPNDMFVSGAFEVSGAVEFLGNLEVGGDLTVMGNDINGADGLNITLMANGEVKVDGNLIVGGNDIKAADGAVALTLSDVSGDVTVKGDLEVEGGKLTLSNGAIIDSETADVLKLDESLVKMTGDLEVEGGKITMSNGAVIDSETAGELKLDESLVKVTGDFEVEGGKITMSNGAVIDSETAGELKLEEDLVKMTGDLEVQGGKITMSNGAVIDSETAGELKLDESLVKVTGDLEVQGGMITLSNGATIDSETAGELKLTEDLISIAGNMTVSGDLVVRGTTTSVNTTNLEVKDAIVGFGYDVDTGEEADGDRGFIFSRVGDNTTMFWDDSADEFKFAFTAATPATGTIDTTDYADLRAGIITSESGFSGSLTKLANGDDYLIAGVGVSIAVNNDGSITISGASDSYAKGYFGSGDLSGDVLDFSSLGELSAAEDKNVDVFLNGVLLRSGAGHDVVSMTSTSVTLNSGITADLQPEDVITVVVRSLLAEV
jgi:phage baseplate assembly protein gpV